MFTGLIQQVGRLAKIQTADGGARLQIHAAWPAPLAPGESIAVNGVCLTAAAITAGGFACDVLQETLQRTNLGDQPAGAKLNLERALRLGDAVGGHLVTGHVDGTGLISSRQRAGRDLVLRIACGPALLAGIVPKGSIAVDGVSLTVAVLEHNAFTVHLIPFTRAASTLDELAAGARVNLETDLIGKYVARHLQAAPAAAPLTKDRLQAAGF